MIHTALFFDVFDTAFGWMGALASPRGLTRTTLPQLTPEKCLAALGVEGLAASTSPGLFDDLRTRLRRYFHGEPVTFADAPVDVDDASPFMQAAWAACREIPRGETRSYKWLAARAGRPLAYRAAGQAMAGNRLPIVVPCHRVVGTDGCLVGFGRGTTQVGLKRRLLALEAGEAPSR